MAAWVWLEGVEFSQGVFEGCILPALFLSPFASWLSCIKPLRLPTPTPRMLLSHFRPKVTEGAKCEMILLKPGAKVNLPALRCSLLNYVTVIKILLTVFWDRKKKSRHLCRLAGLSVLVDTKAMSTWPYSVLRLCFQAPPVSVCSFEMCSPEILRLGKKCWRDWGIDALDLKTVHFVRHFIS